jgi:hypothetical protein
VRVTPQCDSINTVTICATDSIQGNPALDFDGTNYVVVWNDNTAGINRMLAARVTPAGAVLDAGNHIGQSGSDELYPDIVFNGSEYFAAWCHYNEPYGVWARRVSTSAQPVGSIIIVDTTSTYKYMNPKVAYDGTNYLVVWPDMPTPPNFDIFGQLISSSGTLIGNRITISDDTSSEIEVNVVFDGTKYLVAWNDSGAIVGRYVNTAGQPVGSVFPISATSGRVRCEPWVAMSDSNFMVVWAETVTSSKDIYGNVDMVIGVGEHTVKDQATKPLFPPIFSGPMHIPDDIQVTVYDISGSKVDPARVIPGIYFIETEQQEIYKTIKIR